jgi:hypothetical protein
MWIEIKLSTRPRTYLFVHVKPFLQQVIDHCRALAVVSPVPRKQVQILNLLFSWYGDVVRHSVERIRYFLLFVLPL